MKIKILVSGATGQVGQELQHLAKSYTNLEFHFKDRSTFDLSRPESVKDNLLNSDYDFFINAAAYTAVDKAEDETELAKKVNATALECMSAFTPDHCKLIHISTDYVYNHDPKRPLVEQDPTYPVNVYATTKKQGEDFILQRPESIIVRTSWVYSSFGNNFVKTMIRLGKEKDELNIVSDQIGTPTYARDLADALIQIVLHQIKNPDSDFKGIYNYSNAGQTNWADFARTIFQKENISCKVNDTTTAEYNAKAPRPLWSVLSKDKIKRSFGLKIDSWEDSLDKCLNEIRKGL